MDDKLIKNKSLWLLFSGQFISLVGSKMQSFAFALYVLGLTGSSSQFASILALGMIPTLLLTPICGVFADWFDRKKIMIYLDFLLGILYIVIFIVSMTTGITLVHIYLCVIINSIVQSFYSPAAGTAIPSIVNESQLTKANSMESTVTTVGNLIAPILAGAVYGISGVKVMILLNAISFVIAATLECFLNLKTEKLQSPRKSIYKEFVHDFKEGIFFIFDNSLLKYIVIFLFFINGILSSVLGIGIPYICKLLFKVSDLQFGLIQSITVVGTLVGSIMVPFIVSKIELENLFNVVVKASSIVLFLIAIVISPQLINITSNILINFSLLIIIMFIFATICAVLNVAMGTLMQKLTPNNMLGRVMAAGGTVSFIAVPLGQILYGKLFDNVSTYLVYLCSAIIMVIIAFISNKKITHHQDEELVLEKNDTILDSIDISIEKLNNIHQQDVIVDSEDISNIQQSNDITNIKALDDIQQPDDEIRFEGEF